MADGGAPGIANAFSDVDRSDRTAELLAMMEEMDANPAIQRLGAWAFERLAISPGESVLDAGCGLGFDTVRLARLTGPTGRVLGIDFSEAMLSSARERQPADVTNIELRFGDVTALDLPDASVDVIHCERMLQHLEDPRIAVAELARVLKPGGRIALLDTDWETATSSAGSDEIVARMTPFTAGIARSRRVGRIVPVLLHDTGLEVIGVEPAAVAPGPTIINGFAFDQMPTFASLAGTATEDEAREWVAEIRRQFAGGYLAQFVTMIGAVARKPA
jgi:SAM-dependent methyltransferase